MSALFDSISNIERSLSFHLKRHSLLTANVANSETPGYRPLDLTFSEALQTAQRLRRTSTRHMGLSGANEFYSEVFDDSTVTPGQNGNTVSMERELAKLSANSLRYRANIDILQRRMGLIRYAVSDGLRR